MNDDDICEVIITAPDADWLLHHTRSMIEARLAASGHHHQIRSIYTWDGTIHDQPETRVALHTRASHVPAIIAATQHTHPYVVPCIVSVPITQVSDSYKSWVLAATTRRDDPQAMADGAENGTRSADL